MSRAVFLVLAASVALAFVTAAAGWLGLDWDGETDQSKWYVVLGLPFIVGTLVTVGAGVPFPVALLVGGLAQFAFCLSFVALVRFILPTLPASERHWPHQTF